MNERVGVHLSRREEVTLDLFGIMLLFSFERWINKQNRRIPLGPCHAPGVWIWTSKIFSLRSTVLPPNCESAGGGGGLSIASGGFALSNVHVLQFANCLSVLLLSQFRHISRRVLQACGLHKIWAVSFEDGRRLTVLDFGAATS